MNTQTKNKTDSGKAPGSWSERMESAIKASKADAANFSQTGGGDDWVTQAELDAMHPKYFDLRQTAITADGATWNFCGTNAWFRTSAGYGNQIICENCGKQLIDCCGNCIFDEFPNKGF